MSQKKSPLRFWFISPLLRKLQKKMIVWPERGKNPDCFEYRTASERYLVAEICRVEVTEPRTAKKYLL